MTIIQAYYIDFFSDVKRNENVFMAPKCTVDSMHWDH